jgi:hypothetical protein
MDGGCCWKPVKSLTVELAENRTVWLGKPLIPGTSVTEFRRKYLNYLKSLNRMGGIGYHTSKRVKLSISQDVLTGPRMK